ncbi:hypothetical protein HYV64_05575 [Candidatus Shapirobacteria bacterium]|nr:hypothetical protein [Candidatus Shapirobacteria bacterium]
MATAAQVDAMESLNGVLPVDGLCDPLGRMLEEHASAPVSRIRQPMATVAGGQILCAQLDGTICRLKSARCDSGNRRLTAI